MFAGFVFVPPLLISSPSSEVAEAEYVPVTEEHASDSEGETVVYLEAREERIAVPVRMRGTVMRQWSSMWRT